VLESVENNTKPILKYVNFISIDSIRKAQSSISCLPTDKFTHGCIVILVVKI
jgi:hypothetical protein